MAGQQIFGQVHTQIWQSPDFRKLKSDAKVVALYLLTSPHSTALGAYRLPMGYLSTDTGCTIEGASKALGMLHRIGFATYCEATEWLVLPNWFKFHKVQGPKSWTHVMRSLEAMPDVPAKQLVAKGLLQFAQGVSKDHRRTIETLSKHTDVEVEVDTHTDTEKRSRKKPPKKSESPSAPAPALKVGGDLKKGPTPPKDNAPPHVRLAWWFYQQRLEVMGDECFNPYEPKFMTQCQRVIKAKAGGNLQEIGARLNNLGLHNQVDPNFFGLEPGVLLSHWERLAQPPQARNPVRKSSSNKRELDDLNARIEAQDREMANGS
jgi:hypothetical protein